MRILIVGENSEGGAMHAFGRGFKSLGYKVKFFDYMQNIPKSDFKISLFRKLRIFPNIIQINKRLVELVKSHKPDLVFILKGHLLFPRTIKKIKNYSFIFNWYPDDPRNRLTSTRWLLDSIGLYDCCFIWDERLVRVLRFLGAKRAEFLKWWYDPKLHHPIRPTKKDKEKYACDVCFVGTWEPEREKILSELTDFDLKIWGNGWQRIKGPLKKHIKGKAIYGEEMCKAVCSAKINLNLLRRQNRNSHNMRTFEIPACGGFQLATRSPFHRRFFGEGKGIACFGSVPELIEKIKYYLKATENRKKIAKTGYRIVLCNNSIKNRIEEIMKIMKELI